MNKYIFFSFVIIMSIITFNSHSLAEHEKKSACYLDMDITTRTYNNADAVDIESSIISYADDTIMVGIIAQNVLNLDTFQVEVNYDPSVLSFIAAAEDLTYKGIKTILKKNGGSTIGFQATEKKSGTINISNTLIGDDPQIAPEGTGLLAIIKFKVLSDKTTFLDLKNVFFVGSDKTEDPVNLLHGGKIN